MLAHPYGTIEGAEDFLQRLAVQFPEAYLKSIGATANPKLAEELADAAEHWAGHAPSARGKKLVEACFKAAVGQSREVDLPPPQGEDDYGFLAPAPDNEELPPRVISPTIFFRTDPPPRRWIVRDWIPYGGVTGLYGDGGIGKTLLAQQLQSGTALGTRRRPERARQDVLDVTPRRGQHPHDLQPQGRRRADEVPRRGDASRLGLRGAASHNRRGGRHVWRRRKQPRSSAPIRPGRARPDRT